MNQMLAALGLSGGEFMIIAVAVLILFGAKKIPEFAKGLGQGIKEFKKASREVQDEIERAGQESYTPPPPPPSAPAPSVQEPQPPTAQPSTPGNPPPASPTPAA
jgi:sec-independent protein translocase protein TatA